MSMDLWEELKKIDGFLAEAMVWAEGTSPDGSCSFTQMERLNDALERAAILSRNALERLRPRVDFPQNGKPVLPEQTVYGTIRLFNGYWLHIRLETLLPHCRFQVPAYLADTLTQLLDSFVEGGMCLPYYDKALLVIDEHCDCRSRTVYDQDNKGWKAISNALKGRIIPDDDQYSLAIALLSTRSGENACGITVLDIRDAGEFFAWRSGLDTRENGWRMD